jgi:hypothetical protein
MTIPPEQRPAWVQNDVFCPCGYNLYAQRVEVDQRLQMPLCRCPECGRFHAMTTTFATQSPWRSRQEQIAIVFFTLAIIFVIAMATFGLFGLQMGCLAIRDDIERYAERAQLNLFEYEYYWFEITWGPTLMRSLCVVSGFIYAAVCVTFFWHWRKPYYRLLALVPIGTGIFLLWVVAVNEVRLFGAPYFWPELLTATVALLAGIIAGVRYGRPTVRALMRLVMPPKWLMPFSFLWLVDGLPSPSLNGLAKELPGRAPFPGQIASPPQSEGEVARASSPCAVTKATGKMPVPPATSPCESKGNSSPDRGTP